MNKKARFGGIFLGVAIIITIFCISNTTYQDWRFDQNGASYCKLSYQSSDIDVKISYFDKCISFLDNEEFKGYAAWWFYTPEKNADNLYQVAYSLQKRLYDLKILTKSSFEYQTGMAQVEDELDYFVNGQTSKESTSQPATLNYFKTLYCYKHSLTKYLC